MTLKTPQLVPTAPHLNDHVPLVNAAAPGSPHIKVQSDPAKPPKVEIGINSIDDIPPEGLFTITTDHPGKKKAFPQHERKVGDINWERSFYFTNSKIGQVRIQGSGDEETSKNCSMWLASARQTTKDVFRKHSAKTRLRKKKKKRSSFARGLHTVACPRSYFTAPH